MPALRNKVLFVSYTTAPKKQTSLTTLNLDIPRQQQSFNDARCLLFHFYHCLILQKHVISVESHAQRCTMLSFLGVCLFHSSIVCPSRPSTGPVDCPICLHPLIIFKLDLTTLFFDSRCLLTCVQ